MRFLFSISIYLFWFLTLGCSDNRSGQILTTRKTSNNILDTSQRLVVNIYHTNGFPPNDILVVDEVLRDIYGAEIVHGGPVNLPPSCFNTKSGKLVADSALKFLGKTIILDEGKCLLLTTKTISTNRELHGKTYPDWTIMGYGQVGGRNCVVSTATLKTKKTERLKKVVLHELGHNLGVNHCTFSDTCLMKDLKGVGSAIDKSAFQMCSKCKTYAVDFN